MSLEGLNSLIQLESTRLEGAKAVTQNFQSVASTVQQQGLQTAQSKGSMAIQRIDAQYTKECSEADVRKLERRLVRERASEALSKNIAVMSLLGNAIGNFGHLVNDIKGRQKLGDSPEYLKTPPIDPAKATISMTDAKGGEKFIYASSANSDGSETVYGYRANANSSTNKVPIAANISEYDKERILGDDYDKLKTQNGGKPLNFADLRKANPEMAERLLQARGHGVSRDEASNLMQVLDARLSSTSVTSTQSPGQQKAVGQNDATILSDLLEITSLPNTSTNSTTNASQVSTITSLLNKNFGSMSPALKTQLFGSDVAKETDPKKIETAIKNAISAPADFTKKLTEAQASSFTANVYLASPNKTNPKSEDVQTNDNGLTFTVDDITPDDKARILKDPKYAKMSFAQILREGDGSRGRELVAGKMKEKVDQLDEPGKAKLNEEIGKLDEEIRKRIFPGGQFNPQAFASLMSSNPSAAQKVVEGLGRAGVKNVQPLDLAQASQNVTGAEIDKRIVESRSALKQSLGDQGKLDNRSLGKKVSDIGKAGMSFLVNTMKDSAPYFQAYLKAKDRADSVYEELLAAMDRLNAANKKLKSMEMQIDAFGGRGA